MSERGPNEERSGDVELAGGRKEWASLGGRDEIAKELAVRVVKDGRRISRGIAIELAAGALATGTCVWMLARSRGELVTVVLCAAILIFVGVWCTRLLTLRKGTIAAADTGLDAFIELTRRRLEDDLRWSAFSKRAMVAMSIFVVPWGVWAVVARWELYRAEPWRAVVGFGGAALVWAGCYVLVERRRVKLEAERERFLTLVAERTAD